MKVIIFIIEAIISYLIAGYVHELGHVSAGIFYGWKFEMLVLGPIGFKNEDGKVKIYLEKNMVFWAGVGGTMPKDNSTDNMKIWMKILLAGPMFSLIFGLLVLPVALYTQILFLIFLSFMAIGMGIACLIPMKTGILYSDGGRILRLKRGGQKALEELALFNLTLIDNLGSSYKESDYSSISHLINSDDLNIKYYGHYFAFKYFKERENKEEVK